MLANLIAKAEDKKKEIETVQVSSIDPKYINVIKGDELNESINGVYNYYYENDDQVYWYTGIIKTGEFNGNGQLYKWISELAMYKIVQIGVFSDNRLFNGDRFTYANDRDDGKLSRYLESIHHSEVSSNYGLEVILDPLTKTAIVVKYNDYTEDFINKLTIDEINKINDSATYKEISRADSNGPINMITGWYNITFTKGKYSNYTGEMKNGFFHGVGTLHTKMESSDKDPVREYQLGVFTKGVFRKGDWRVGNMIRTGIFNDNGTFVDTSTGQIRLLKCNALWKGRCYNNIIQTLISSSMDETDYIFEGIPAKISKKEEDTYAIMTLPNAEIKCELNMLANEKTVEIVSMPKITFSNDCSTDTLIKFCTPLDLSGKGGVMLSYTGNFWFPIDKGFDISKFDVLSFKFYLMTTFTEFSKDFFLNYTKHVLTEDQLHNKMEEKDWKELGLADKEYMQLKDKLCELNKDMK